MLKSQRHNADLCLLGALSIHDSVRVLLTVFQSFFSLIRRRRFPSQNASGLKDPVGAVGFPDLCIIQATANNGVLQERVHLSFDLARLKSASSKLLSLWTLTSELFIFSPNRATRVGVALSFWLLSG